MFIEPGAPLVSFVYSDSDMDYDETRKQINTTSSGIMWLDINLEAKQNRFHEYITKRNKRKQLGK